MRLVPDTSPAAATSATWCVTRRRMIPPKHVQRAVNEQPHDLGAHRHPQLARLAYRRVATDIHIACDRSVWLWQAERDHVGDFVMVEISSVQFPHPARSNEGDGDRRVLPFPGQDVTDHALHGPYRQRAMRR